MGQDLCGESDNQAATVLMQSAAVDAVEVTIDSRRERSLRCGSAPSAVRGAVVWREARREGVSVACRRVVSVPKRRSLGCRFH